MQEKVIIICGPTATGKTKFAKEIARHLNGELVSADSRQVYRGLDIITGKDHGDYKIWLVDLVDPDEPFSVSQWHDLAIEAISDIQSRGKLPIIVGGTGLYLKSLTTSLSTLSIPPNPILRKELSRYSASELFNKLKSDCPDIAASLNQSDSQNPRRLIRRLEIETYKLNKHPSQSQISNSYLTLCLSAPLSYLDSAIESRVKTRLSQGAQKEAEYVLSKYSHHLPSISACGYPAFLTEDPLKAWIVAERQYARRQLTWFKKQPNLNWIDISLPDWKQKAISLVV